MYNASEEEKKILEFWDKDKTFEKSVAERPESKPYVFYDGPPFATGLPHYGHIVASAMKDIVPRYFTMRGFKVERKWGWDCHGLPIENIIEKDLELHNRRDIENYGIAKFNEACRATVLKYAEDWKKTIRRMGRWVDMEHDYKTMDPQFMESVWWVFKQLWDHDYVYKGHKPMHICPRCATTLSNFEVTQGYKDVKDLSVTAKFKLKETHQKKKLFGDEPTYILAWTTTPWTLPGNVLLAVGESIKYQVLSIKGSNGKHIVAAERSETVFKDLEYVVDKEMTGKDLVGLEYEPLFPYFADTIGAFRVVAADFVTTEDGTGIVHIAPGYGEDDFNLGKAENVPLVQHVNMEGRFTKEVVDFADMEVKPKDDPSKADVEIIRWLSDPERNGGYNKLFSKQKIEHSYPHCWRCDTPLLNYATTSWFVRVGDMRELLLKNNDKINWVPEHIKEGRFGKWLEGARDWAISRSRYWGTPLPVWESEDGEVLCLGSIAELEEHAGKKVPDIHKHLIDDIEIEHLGKKYRRVPEVFDCWFESGSMPYGQMHYPFENRDKFEASFPAEFIAEGQDQTRGWFYTLHVLATALTSGKNPAITSCGSAPAFKNVIVNGIVLAEDGKKMSKKLKNYPDPEIVMEKYGADAMRFYLASSPVMAAESLNFSEAGVREMFNKVVNTLANVLEFYVMFANEGVRNKEQEIKRSTNVLDKWILSKLHQLIFEVTGHMETYHLAEAARPIVDFITELSQWYVRRSRDRFKQGTMNNEQGTSDGETDKQHALHTLKEVLTVLAKLMAPFTPFIAEKVWQAVTTPPYQGGDRGGSPSLAASSPQTATSPNLSLERRGSESVHLQQWPAYHPEHHIQAILDEMSLARKIVEMGLALRAESKQKVRQPLATLLINKDGLSHELKAVIADELNVKTVDFAEYQEVTNGWVEKVEGDVSVWLDTNVTEELKREGWVRELIRTVNQLRKEAGMTIADRVVIQLATSSNELSAWIKSIETELMTATLATKLEEVSELTTETKLDLDGTSIKIAIVKI